MYRSSPLCSTLNSSSSSSSSRHADIQTYRHTDVQTYRHTGIQAYRHTDMHASVHARKRTYIHITLALFNSPSRNMSCHSNSGRPISKGHRKLWPCEVQLIPKNVKEIKFLQRKHTHWTCTSKSKNMGFRSRSFFRSSISQPQPYSIGLCARTKSDKGANIEQNWVYVEYK